MERYTLLNYTGEAVDRFLIYFYYSFLFKQTEISLVKVLTEIKFAYYFNVLGGSNFFFLSSKVLNSFFLNKFFCHQQFTI